jgi:hypothetical protein
VRDGVFDETASGPVQATRGDGDAAAMPDPLRGATEGARGHVASPARGREDRRRVVQRGGAVDRGSARTALHRTRGRPGLVSGRALGRPFGDHVMVAARAEAGGSPSSEAPPGWAHPASGPAGLPNHATAAHAQDGSAPGEAIRREAQRGPGCDRESSEPQGARDGSRLQKSVRRIFLVANATPEPATARRSSGPWSDGASAPSVARGSSRRPACP